MLLVSSNELYFHLSLFKQSQHLRPRPGQVYVPQLHKHYFQCLHENMNDYENICGGKSQTGKSKSNLNRLCLPTNLGRQRQIQIIVKSHAHAHTWKRITFTYKYMCTHTHTWQWHRGGFPLQTCWKQMATVPLQTKPTTGAQEQPKDQNTSVS